MYTCINSIHMGNSEESSNGWYFIRDANYYKFAGVSMDNSDFFFK